MNQATSKSDDPSAEFLSLLLASGFIKLPLLHLVSAIIFLFRSTAEQSTPCLLLKTADGVPPQLKQTVILRILSL